MLSFFNQRYTAFLVTFISVFQFLSGIALSQVIESVEDKINSSAANAIPVFMMKDLRRLYQEMLWNLDASEEIINNVNVTRLKEEILQEVPALREQRNGKFILLTLDAHVGKALFDVTQNSHKDYGIVLSRAAKIIRKHMFDKEEIFNADFSR